MKDTNTREHTTNANDNDGGDNDDDVRLFLPGSGGNCLSSLELAWSLACDRTSSEFLTGVDMDPGLDMRSSSRLR